MVPVLFEGAIFFDAIFCVGRHAAEAGARVTRYTRTRPAIPYLKFRALGIPHVSAQCLAVKRTRVVHDNVCARMVIEMNT